VSNMAEIGAQRHHHLKARLRGSRFLPRTKTIHLRTAAHSPGGRSAAPSTAERHQNGVPETGPRPQLQIQVVSGAGLGPTHTHLHGEGTVSRPRFGNGTLGDDLRAVDAVYGSLPGVAGNDRADPIRHEDRMPAGSG
jgi:hypothetical protein